MLRSIRARLLLVFAGLALVAVGGMAVAAVSIVRGRADAHARVDFRAAGDQLGRSLALRYQAFQAASDLSYVLPVFRQVAAQQDGADFGLGTAEDDASHLRTLHDNLIDADWNWAQTAGTGFIAVADAKGRLLYTSADRSVFGGDATKWLTAMGVFDPERRNAGAMMLGPRDGSGAVSVGLLPAGRRLMVLFARATVLGGQPRAVFVQGIPAQALLQDVALGASGMALAMLSPAGDVAGTLPAPVLEVARHLTGQEVREVQADGARWLVQVQPVLDLNKGSQIGYIAMARNLDVGLAALQQAATSMIAVALMLVVLALAASLWLSQRLSRPIEELELAAARVADGDLTVQVPVRERDEIGRLATTFNRMIEGLRERDRIKFTFKKYLAPDIVDYLLAHPEAQRPGGDRRELTVMFTDLAKFTTFAESRRPEEVVEVLNTCLTAMATAIADTGGTLDKFIGDNVMAFFGAPIPRPDHARRAVRAALQQAAALEQLAPRWRAEAWPDLGLRIGIHTGEMIVGTIGGGQGQDYTVIGDAVNLAARLESANKEYGTRILCTEAVWLAVNDEFDCRELDCVRVMGKQQPVRLYEVLGARGWLARNPDKLIALACFRDGLAHHRTRDFAGAIQDFEAALVADPTDGPSRVLLARARARLTIQTPTDWDGVHQLEVK